MHFRKIIMHPLALIISFMIILISGQHTGGFYIIYLVMGVLHGAVHALLGFAGIVLLLPGLIIEQRKQASSIYLLNIFGTICMFLSLFLFFFMDEQQYNAATFYQVIPLCTIVLFCFLAVIFLTGNIRTLFKPGLIKK